MIDTIINYWVVAACGLVAAFFTWLIRYIIRNENKKFQELLETREEKAKEAVICKLQKEIDEEVNKSNNSDKAINADIESLKISVNNLTRGLLTVQGKEFKEDCRILLDPDHEITIDEYEDIVEDHEAYNGLGGNHRGDSLFRSVMKKWNSQVRGE